MNNIPNMIKQPALCCMYCGKSYKKRQNLNKHITICEITINSRKTITEEFNIPNSQQIFELVVELANRCNRLEKKIEELSKNSNKENKKLDVISWLNINIVPEIKFDNLLEKINITNEDIKPLYNNKNFVDILNNVFSNNIYNYKEYNYPLYAFNQKPHKLYVYLSSEYKWRELDKDELIKFLNKIHMKIYKALQSYKKENEDMIENNDSELIKYDKIVAYLMNINFNINASILGKIKNAIYSNIKRDINVI